MKRKLVIVAFALAGLASANTASAQQSRALQETSRAQVRTHGDTQLRSQAQHPVYQRRDTWYEFLLKQFNPANFDYGTWMEERRKVFLNESVRNPYFRYSTAVTIALLLLTAVCAKQWIDHRRAMWITAEMMADLYNHDLYSRNFAERAIQKYNDHIERCNRAVEMNQNGNTAPTGDSGRDELNAQLQKTASELNRSTKEKQSLEEKLKQKSEVIVALSLRVDALTKKNGGLQQSGQPIDLTSADPQVMQLINDLQEQLQHERDKNRRLKGA